MIDVAGYPLAGFALLPFMAATSSSVVCEQADGYEHKS